MWIYRDRECKRVRVSRQREHCRGHCKIRAITAAARSGSHPLIYLQASLPNMRMRGVERGITGRRLLGYLASPLGIPQEANQ